MKKYTNIIFTSVSNRYGHNFARWMFDKGINDSSGNLWIYDFFNFMTGWCHTQMLLNYALEPLEQVET